MNNITYAVSVDVNNPIIPYNVYVANVLDSNVRYLEITLYQNGDVIALSNEATATASLVIDDVLIDDSVECTISNNIITVPLEDLQRHGNLGVQVTVTEDTKVLAIPFPIQVRVTPNITEEAQIDENSLGSYAEVVHEIAEARGTYTTLHDAIAAKAPLSTAYTFDSTTANVTYNAANPKTIYLNATVDGEAGIVITAKDNGFQYFLGRRGALKIRCFTGGTSYSDWTQVTELVGNKKNSITNANKTSTEFYPSIKALVDYVAANCENLSNKLTSDDGIDEDSTDLQYPTAKAVYDALAGKANTNHTHSQYLTSHQSLAGLIGTDKVYEILDSALSGDPSNIPALLVDNTVDQTHNPDGHYILYYIDSDEVRHNIFDISEYFVGKTSETVTKTVTLFDGTAINETLSEANSDLRYVIWGTTGAHLSFEAGKTYHIEITCTEVNLSSVTSVRLMHYPNGSTITNYQIFAPVVSGNVLTCDYTVPENGTGLLLRLNAKAGAQNVSLKVTTEEETEIAVSNSDALPSYCADEIGRVKKAVLDQANYGDVVFGVFTDLHFAENDSEASAAQKWNAIKIMRRLADETILDFVIQGGDLLTNGYYENDTYKLNKAQNLFSGCRAPLYTSKGDHDSNQTDTKITKSDFAKRTAPYMPKAIRSADYPNNYYFDLPEKKTRVINIDTGTVMAGQGNNGAEYKTWGNETLYNWLLDEVLTDEVKTGWKFIVFTHAPCDCEWQFGMAKRFRASHSTDISNSQNSAKGNMLAINDLFEAINSAGTFSTDKEFHRYTLTHDSDNVLQSAVQTSDAMGGDVYGISGIYQEQATSTQFIRTKSFSGWTSKARMILSGHCHCDRLNKSTLKPDGSGNYVRGTASYAIAYTAAAAYNGYKDASTYYIPCFGADGQIASWGHIQTSDRTLGTLGEQLMDVWIVGDTCVRRVRFGAGAGNALLSSVINV